MTEFTKEQRDILIKTAEYMVKRENTSEYSENIRKVAEIALAALTAGMEQEPAIEVSEGDVLSEIFTPGTKLYAAPQLPQPAVLSVPDEIPKLKDGRGYKYVKDGVRYSVSYANGWNQCRAAMLQGAEPKKDMQKEFERWMLEDQKCILGGTDPYAQHMEERNWSAWKTIWSLFYRKE